MKKPRDKKDGVRVKWSKRQVILVERGDTISLIKWADTKTDQAIPNDQLEFDE